MAFSSPSSSPTTQLLEGRQVIIDVELADAFQLRAERLRELYERHCAHFPSGFVFNVPVWDLIRLWPDVLDGNVESPVGRYLAFTEGGVALVAMLLRRKPPLETITGAMRAFALTSSFPPR